MKKILLLVLLAFNLSSCQKIKFKQGQLDWFNVYNKKDMLVFESLRTHKRDTTIILEKKVIWDFDPWLNGTELPQIARMKYYNKNLTDTYAKNEDYLFYLFSESTPGKQLKYLGAGFSLSDTATTRTVPLSLTPRSFTNAYRLTSQHNRGNKPEILYWDTQYGIIKYMTRDGEMWERINW